MLTLKLNMYLPNKQINFIFMTNTHDLVHVFSSGLFWDQVWCCWFLWSTIPERPSQSPDLNLIGNLQLLIFKHYESNSLWFVFLSFSQLRCFVSRCDHSAVRGVNTFDGKFRAFCLLRKDCLFFPVMFFSTERTGNRCSLNDLRGKTAHKRWEEAGILNLSLTCQLSSQQDLIWHCFSSESISPWN